MQPNEIKAVEELNQGSLPQILALPWHEDKAVAVALQPILMRLGAHYVYCEKKRGKALCPVANFHLRNGAIFERLNWLADVSPKVKYETV